MAEDEQLTRIEGKLDRIFENHFPHIEHRLGWLQGQMALVLTLLVSVAGALAFVITKL